MVLERLLNGVLDLALPAAKDVGVIDDVCAGWNGDRVRSPGRAGREGQHSSHANHGEYTFHY